MKSKVISTCPVTVCLSVIGGKWKLLIIWLLYNDIRRFGEMRRKMPGITKQMLTKQLRELEQDGIIHREVFAEVPPRVEYSFTEFGESLLPVVFAMRDWGNAQKQALAKTPPRPGKNTPARHGGRGGGDGREEL